MMFPRYYHEHPILQAQLKPMLTTCAVNLTNTTRMLCTAARKHILWWLILEADLESVPFCAALVVAFGSRDRQRDGRDAIWRGAC